MRLADLVIAQKQQKELARTVGRHLAHMIWLYAKQLWDEGKVKAHRSFDDFWAHYSRGGWKRDFLDDRFIHLIDDALERRLTKEDHPALARRVRTARR